MFSVNAGALAKIATALMNGDDNVIERMVERKIESLGAKLIDQIISATPLGPAIGMAGRAQAAVATGGMSELDRLRRQWLSSISPVRNYNRIAGKLASPFGKLSRAARQVRRRKEPWERTDWAHSRTQWLEEGWKHDWRSQPREPAGLAFHVAGTWMEGRLDYPLMTTSHLPVTKQGHVGKPVSRKRRFLRKRRARQRAVGRRIVRSSQIMSTWGRDIDGD